MLSDIACADRCAQNLKTEELLASYCRKTKSTPQGAAMRAAYKKYGIVLPEMQQAGIVRTCASCNQVSPPGTKFQACKRCKEAHYCSRECQVYHWKKGGHRQNCKEAPECSDSSGLYAAAADVNSNLHAVSKDAMLRETAMADREKLLCRKLSQCDDLGSMAMAGGMDIDEFKRQMASMMGEMM